MSHIPTQHRQRRRTLRARPFRRFRWWLAQEGPRLSIITCAQAPIPGTVRRPSACNPDFAGSCFSAADTMASAKGCRQPLSTAAAASKTLPWLKILKIAPSSRNTDRKRGRTRVCQEIRASQSGANKYTQTCTHNKRVDVDTQTHKHILPCGHTAERTWFYDHTDQLNTTSSRPATDNLPLLKTETPTTRI